MHGRKVTMMLDAIPPHEPADERSEDAQVVSQRAEIRHLARVRMQERQRHRQHAVLGKYYRQIGNIAPIPFLIQPTSVKYRMNPADAILTYRTCYRFLLNMGSVVCKSAMQPGIRMFLPTKN